MSNILEFKITDDGHAKLRYVGDQGERLWFDLTAHVEETVKRVLARHAEVAVSTAPPQTAVSGTLQVPKGKMTTCIDSWSV